MAKQNGKKVYDFAMRGVWIVAIVRIVAIGGVYGERAKAHWMVRLCFCLYS